MSKTTLLSILSIILKLLPIGLWLWRRPTVWKSISLMVLGTLACWILASLIGSYVKQRRLAKLRAERPQDCID